uniref:Uncharacterized protein n=1 Tax=Rhizophora mucronata TaxID=61149 RepID=A0A2P2PQX2_RHIMU
MLMQWLNNFPVFESSQRQSWLRKIIFLKINTKSLSNSGIPGKFHWHNSSNLKGGMAPSAG